MSDRSAASRCAGRTVRRVGLRGCLGTSFSRRVFHSGAILLALASVVTVTPSRAQLGTREVVLATTTSTRDAGLLDVLGPAFERASRYRVLTVAVGSGQALRMARRGDADVVLAHSPDAERQLEAAGLVRNRRRVMYNDFVIVGPRADPAAIRGMPEAVRALQAVFRRGAPFFSRGDESGTHALERRLWRRAGIEPAGDWYRETGQGMGATLTIAQERRAYTLADRGTYLAWRGRDDLDILVEGDTALFNQYHVMEVSPTNAPRVNAAGGKAFADFLVSAEGQRLIRDFGVERYGRALFVPNAVVPAQR